MIKKDAFQKLKCRRVYKFYLDEKNRGDNRYNKP